MTEYNIYIVEDEEHLASVLKAYLEKEGWIVRVIHDGEEALKQIENPPHLWVLDIMLPGVDGYEILRKIRENSDTPVIERARSE